MPKMRQKMKLLALCAGALLLSATGCRHEVLASEDLEVPVLFRDDIAVLQNPMLPTNGQAKYEAIEHLMEYVDFTLTRETKTLNEIFYHKDAIIENLGDQSRIISFNYQFEEKNIRLRFFAYNAFIYRVDITKK